VRTGLLQGPAQHLAIAHRTCRTAKPHPIRPQDFDRPTEAMGRRIDCPIGTTGAAMEQQLHEVAMGARLEIYGHPGGGPIEITATGGDNHQ
jgi:hypothetical protein